MAKVQNYLPQVRTRFFCSKGGLHAQQVLDVVCLDPLCRNNPLGCPICFSQFHKYHRVISVDKFVDDYSRNVKIINQNKVSSKINNHYQVVSNLINRLRQDINSKLDQFTESIDQYAQELRYKTRLRQSISRQIGIPLEPSQIRTSRNQQEFEQFLKFTLNNCRFDKNNSMTNIVDLLKQDQQKIHVLLDKMVNMTQLCYQYIQEAIKSLNFSDQTLNRQKITERDNLNNLKTTKDSFNTSQFVLREKIHKTIANTIQLKKPHWRSSLTNNIDLDSTINNQPKQLKFKFDSLNKHQMIQIKQKSSIGISNISALKPQYAFMTPHLTTEPNQFKQWILKINKCRNFASQNTLAIGVATLNDMKQAKYQGSYPKKAVMLTSQGYVLQNGSSRKTNVIFGEGDLLYCSYDPYYSLFEIGKQNGRKIALKVQKPQNQELYICVRLTYASDQIQIL